MEKEEEGKGEEKQPGTAVAAVTLVAVASLTRFLFSHPICLVDVAARRVFFNREIHEEPDLAPPATG